MCGDVSVKYSKFLVTFIISVTILFTISILYIFWKTGEEPTTLIGCWFGTFLAELWALSKIKREKIKNSGDKNVN